MVSNHFCQRPALVIKIRGIPSWWQNAATFPSFISYLSVASGAKYSEISASIVFPGYWQNSSVTWYMVGGGVYPITVRSEALTVSKHFHFIVTSECCSEILGERQIFFLWRNFLVLIHKADLEMAALLRRRRCGRISPFRIPQGVGRERSFKE